MQNTLSQKLIKNIIQKRRQIENLQKKLISYDELMQKYKLTKDEKKLTKDIIKLTKKVIDSYNKELQQDQDKIYEYVQQLITEDKKYILKDAQQKNEIGSDDLETLQRQIYEQQQMSDKMKDLLMTNLWQNKATDEQQIKTQYQQTQKKKRTSGNDNFYKIQQYEDDNFFIPSNGDCFFKCLQYCLKDEIQNEDFQFFYNKLYLENHRQFNFGISSFKARQIIQQIEKQLKIKNLVQIVFPSRMDRNYECKYIITLYDFHFILLKNGRQTYIDHSHKLENLFEELKKDQQITQDDILNMVTKSQIIQFTRKIDKNDKIDQEDDLMELLMQNQNNEDEENDDEYQPQFTSRKKKQIVFADFESYQQNEESEQIPYTIGFFNVKNYNKDLITQNDIVNHYFDYDTNRFQPLFKLNEKQQQNIDQQKQLKNQIKKLEEQILELGIEQKYESEQYLQLQNQINEKCKQLKQIQQQFESKEYKTFKLSFGQDIGYKTKRQDALGKNDKLLDCNIGNMNSTCKFYRQITSQNPKTLINKFIEDMFLSLRTNDYFEKEQYVFFHNGRRYDFILILKYIDNQKYKVTNIQTDGQAILSFSIKKNEKSKTYSGTLKFRDSNRFLISSLKKISQSMNLSFQKIEIDSKDLLIKEFEQYSQNPELQQKIDEYLFFDCMSLAEGILKFRDCQRQFFIESFGEDFELLEIQTTSQLAAKYQQFYLKYELEKPLNILDYQYVLPSIFQNYQLRNYIRGGRTNCYFQSLDHEKHGQFYYLDMNSLYPSGMKFICELGGYPILDQNAKIIEESQFEKYIDKFHNYKNTSNDTDFLNEAYLIICDIYQPPTPDFLFNNVNTKCGKLYCTSDYEGNQIFKNQYYTSWDIYYSIKYNGLQIKKIHQIIYLPSRLQLYHDKMMDDLRNLRKQYQKENQDIMAENCKLIMNSIYGKLIQKTLFSENKIVKDLNQYQKQNIEKLYVNSFKIGDSEDEKNQQYLVYCKNFTLKQFSNNISDPILGSFLLAGTKHLMNQIIIKAECYKFDSENIQQFVIYTDTDSIIVGEKAFQIINKLGFIGSDLGQIKLEHIVKTGYEGYGKKIYRFIDENGKKQSRFKGVSFQKVSNKTDEKVEDIIDKCFDAMKKGESQFLEFDNFVRTLKTQSIQVKTCSKQINSTFQLEKTILEFDDFIFYHNKQYIGE